MKRFLALLCMLSSVALSAAPTGSTKDYSHSQSQLSSSGDKWPMYLELEGKKGNFRNIARLSWMVPLWQDDTSMLFGDVRLMMDNRHDREVNIGLGYRTICKDWDMGSEGVVLGAYAFFDRKKSPFGNKYNQGTFGVEALGDYFRFSGNYYMPQNKKSHIASRFNPSIVRSGWNAVNGQAVFTFNTLLNPTDDIERTLKGYDVELRGKVPVTDVFNIWGGVGAYRFSRSGLHRNGPMAMVDVELLDGLGIDGSRASLGFEYRKDKGFKANRFGVLKLTTPLASVGKGKDYPSLTGVEYEMTRFISRDVDVQTGVETKRSDRTLFSSGNAGATAVAVTENGLIDIHVQGLGVQASVLRADHLGGDFPATMIEIAGRDTGTPMVVFTGALSGTPMQITDALMLSAYNNVSEAEHLSEEQKFVMTRCLSENCLPVPMNVFYVGMENHRLDHKQLSSEHVLTALRSVKGLEANIATFIGHLKANVDSFKALVSEDTPTLVSLPAGIEFSKDGMSSFAVNAPLSVITAADSSGKVQPVLRNVNANSISLGTNASGTNAVRVTLNNPNSVNDLKGDLIQFDNPSAYASLAPVLSVAPGQNVTGSNLSGLHLAAFNTNKDAASIKAALVNNPKPKFVGLNIPFAKVDATGATTPFIVPGSLSANLPIDWSLTSASGFVTFAAAVKTLDVTSRDNFIVGGLGGFTVNNSAQDVVKSFVEAPLNDIENDLPSAIASNSAAAVSSFLEKLKEFSGESITLADVQDSLIEKASVTKGSSKGSIPISVLADDDTVAPVMAAALSAENFSAAKDALGSLLKPSPSSADPTSAALQTAASMLVTGQGTEGAKGVANLLIYQAETNGAVVNSVLTGLIDDPKTEALMADSILNFVETVDPASDAFTSVMGKVSTFVQGSHAPLFETLAGGTGTHEQQLIAADVIKDVVTIAELSLLVDKNNPQATATLIKDIFAPSAGANEAYLKHQSGALSGLLTTDLSENSLLQAELDGLLLNMIKGPIPEGSMSQ